MNNSLKNKAKGYLITSMLIFGSVGLFVKNIDLPSGQIALVRGVIGTLFILLASMLLKLRLAWKAIKKNLILLLVSGALIGFNWIFLFEAYRYTSISNATLSYYFAPVFVIFLSPIVLKERLTLYKIFCCGIAIVGMFMIIRTSEEPGSNHLLGIGLGLLAALLYAGVILMNKFIHGLSGLETTLFQLGTASLVLLPYVMLTEKLQIFRVNHKSLLLLLVVGILHTGISYLLYFSAMKDISGQTIALYSYIDPIFAIVLSGILLKEGMTLQQVVGGILILGASYVSDHNFSNHIDNKK